MQNSIRPKTFSKTRSAGKRNKVILAAVLVLIVLIIATLSARIQKRKKLQALEKSEKTEQAFPVKVTEIHYSDIASFVRSSAVIQAWQEAVVSSEVSGKVKTLYAKVGDRLEPGAPILKIDDEMLQYRLEEAQAKILQLEANHQYSNNDLRRKEELFKGKIISLYDLELARAKEKSDQGLLASAQAALKIARRTLRETLIKSPFSGILAERFVALGSNVVTGQKIAVLVDIDRVKIRIGATEKEWSVIREGQAVKVTTALNPGKIYTGSVYSMGLKADDATLTFPVEIVVWNNQEPLLKPGIFARVEIQTEMHRNVIIVPGEIVSKASDSSFVWAVESGRAKKIAVEPGAVVDSSIIIKKGLNPGDRIVTLGQENLFNGSPVKIIE